MGDLAALAQRHSHAHTSEQRAAALDLSASVQGDTYPADIIWAEAGTRTLTVDEVAWIYLNAEDGPVMLDDNEGMTMLGLIGAATAVFAWLLGGGFLVVQAMKWMGVW